MPGAGGYAFGPYRLETQPLALRREGALVPLSPPQLAMLHALVSRAGEIVPKDVLVAAGWRDTRVTDSSLVKMVFQLRQHLDPGEPELYIKTVARHGYRFVAPVSVERDYEDFSARLAPRRAWTEGRAALEVLQGSQVPRALATFEQQLVHHPGSAEVHVGLANSRAMQFELTRTNPEPDLEALRIASAHAHQACSLNPNLAEAWATLGFILHRTGEREDALSALNEAVALEPDNFVHLLRLAEASWGRPRLAAARRALVLCPHLPMAHWLAATLNIGLGALDLAGQEVQAGLAMAAAESKRPARFSTVGLHWIAGLLCLARGAADEAVAAFDRELALEASGHVYARECCANTWYAKGAYHLRGGMRDAARAAFGEAIARGPRHPMAHAGLAILDDTGDPVPTGAPPAVDHAFARAARLVWRGDAHAAANLVEAALDAAPPGNAGWLLAIEPLLDVGRAPEAWSDALAALQFRAR